MSTEVGAIHATLTLISDKFEAGMRQANQIAQNTSRVVAAQIGDMKSAVERSLAEIGTDFGKMGRAMADAQRTTAQSMQAVSAEIRGSAEASRAALEQAGQATTQSMNRMMAGMGAFAHSMRQSMGEVAASMREASEATKGSVGQMDAVLKEAAGAFQRMGQEARTAAQQTQRELDGMRQKAEEAKQGWHAIGLALTAFGTAVEGALTFAGHRFIEFEGLMRRANMVAGLLPPEFEKVSETVLSFARDNNLTKGPRDLAESLFNIYSAVPDTANAMAILKEAAKGASAGLVDTGVASEALIGVMHAYNLAVGDTAAVAKSAKAVDDQLFQAVHNGIMTYGQLAQTVGGVTTTAAQAHIPIAELLGDLSTLTMRGIKVDEAVTSMNQAILHMITPHRQAGKIMEELGIHIDQTTIAQHGLNASMKELYDKTGGNIAALQLILQDVTAVKAVLALASDGFELASENIEKQKKASERLGKTTEALTEVQKSLKYQMGVASAEIEEAAIRAGKVLAPALRMVTGLARDAARAFSGAGDTMRSFTVITAGVTGGLSLLGGGLMVLSPQIKAAIDLLISFGKTATGAKIATVLFADGVGAILIPIGLLATAMVVAIDNQEAWNKKLDDSVQEGEKYNAILRKHRNLLRQIVEAQGGYVAGLKTKDDADELSGLTGQRHVLRQRQQQIQAELSSTANLGATGHFEVQPAIGGIAVPPRWVIDAAATAESRKAALDKLLAANQEYQNTVIQIADLDKKISAVEHQVYLDAGRDAGQRYAKEQERKKKYAAAQSATEHLHEGRGSSGDDTTMQSDILDYYKKSADSGAQIIGVFGDSRRAGGARHHAGIHGGIDVAMPRGTLVPNYAPGVVTAVNPWDDGTMEVRVKIGNGLTIGYGHLERGSVPVRVGQAVNQGDPLGRISYQQHVDIKTRDAAGNLVDPATRKPPASGAVEMERSLAQRESDRQKTLADFISRVVDKYEVELKKLKAEYEKARDAAVTPDEQQKVDEAYARQREQIEAEQVKAKEDVARKLAEIDGRSEETALGRHIQALRDKTQADIDYIEQQKIEQRRGLSGGDFVTDDLDERIARRREQGNRQVEQAKVDDARKTSEQIAAIEAEVTNNTLAVAIAAIRKRTQETLANLDRLKQEAQDPATKAQADDLKPQVEAHAQAAENAVRFDNEMKKLQARRQLNQITEQEELAEAARIRNARKLEGDARIAGDQRYAQLFEAYLNKQKQRLGLGYREWLTQQQQALKAAGDTSEAAQVRDNLISQHLHDLKMEQILEWRQAAMQAMQGVLQASGQFLNGMLLEHQKFADAFKTLWQSIAQSVIRAIEDMIAKMVEMWAMKQLLGLFTGGIGGLFDGQMAAIAGPTGGIAGGLHLPSIPGLHTGGIVIPGGVQKFHGGGMVRPRSDEVLTMLQVGERVLTPRQWDAQTAAQRAAAGMLAAGGAARGRREQPSININIDKFEAHHSSDVNAIADQLGRRVGWHVQSAAAYSS